MGFVFISYSRKDTEIVDDVVSKLRNDGFEIWLDRESIKGGDLWRKEIVKAIQTTDAFLLMLSPSSAQSKNVRKEVDLAENANRSLFPFILASVELPEELQYQLIGIQWIEFYKDPERKYQELVEVLQKQQNKSIQPPEILGVEVALPERNLKSFGLNDQQNIIHTLAETSETSSADLHISNITDGSVHLFVDMPADAAYTLKTAALNRDGRLLKQGIEALRFNGEENYVLVSSGEIGPLQLTKRKPPFIKRLLKGGFWLGIIAVIVWILTLGPGKQVLFSTPTAIFTPTYRPTLTPTKTYTPIVSSTPTPLPTSTYSPTSTSQPNIPPSQPEFVSPLHGDHISCDGPAALVWRPAYDADGIAGYEVNLATGGINIFFKQVDGNTTQLDISNEVYKYCNQWLQWRVHAVDQTGLWGDWPDSLVFLAENTPPPAPIIDVDPKQSNGNVSCYASPKLFWNQPSDSNGIANYQIIVDAYNNGSGQWDNIIDEITASTSFDISTLPSKYCNQWIRAKVVARDGLGAWGDWSPWIQFLLELPTPG
jgi:hypothetical protein